MTAPQPLTPARLAEIQGRLDAASAWPWRVWEANPAEVITGGIISVATAHGMDGIDALNAAFIAHAPADLAALLAEVERLGKAMMNARRDLSLAVGAIEIVNSAPNPFAERALATIRAALGEGEDSHG